ncbi:MAG: glycosyltransferase family 2 protein [Candidatus Hodarchaeota archaeon]
MNPAPDHICVCICTYKRPKMLVHLLSVLQNQKTGQLFTYSIVVVDNDHTQSARGIIASFKENSLIDIDYYCESEQNISLARNKAVQNANGDFVAFIDDDEFPTNTWLYNLYKALLKYNVDGVLGTVRPRFEGKPPRWVIKGKFYEKPSDKTGLVLQWRNSRTSNVLLRKSIFNECDNMFDPAFGRGGEDRDFFRRMIEKGCVFVWCAEAPVYEEIPPERCSRSFMLKRALLRGKVSLLHPSFNIFDIIKSLIAVSLYTLALPLLFLIGHHIFMEYLVKDFEHIGKLLAVCGLDVIKQKYVMK